MDNLLLIIAVIFGVLQIILFFKIWGMTNNVAALTDKYIRSTNEELSAYFIAAKYKALGQTDKALEEIDERVEGKINSILADRAENYMRVDQMAHKWENYRLKFEKVYRYFDAEMPEKYRNFDFEKLMKDVATMRQN